MLRIEFLLFPFADFCERFEYLSLILRDSVFCRHHFLENLVREIEAQAPKIDSFALARCSTAVCASPHC